MTNVITLGLLQHYGPDSPDPADQQVCRNKMYKMQSCTNKIVGMLLMHKQDVDNQQVCSNKIVGMFPMHNQVQITYIHASYWSEGRDIMPQ